MGFWGLWCEALGKNLIPEPDLLITKLLWQEISFVTLLLRQKGFLANPFIMTLKPQFLLGMRAMAC